MLDALFFRLLEAVERIRREERGEEVHVVQLVDQHVDHSGLQNVYGEADFGSPLN